MQKLIEGSKGSLLNEYQKRAPWKFFILAEGGPLKVLLVLFSSIFLCRTPITIQQITSHHQSKLSKNQTLTILPFIIIDHPHKYWCSFLNISTFTQLTCLCNQLFPPFSWSYPHSKEFFFFFFLGTTTPNKFVHSVFYSCFHTILNLTFASDPLTFMHCSFYYASMSNY